MFENEIGRNPDTQHGPFDLGISRIAKSPCDWEIRVPYFQYMGGGGVDHDNITEENVKFNWATIHARLFVSFGNQQRYFNFY